MTVLDDKLKKVKFFILDVDGVMSDGKIIISNDGNESKHFDVKDGLALVLLKKAGIRVGIITGKSSNIVETRFRALGVEDIYQGQKNKIDAFNELKQKYQLENEQIAYMGDDLPDLTLMDKVGFSAAPLDANALILPYVDYHCTKAGGQGALRECVERLFSAKGMLDKIVEDYRLYGEAMF